jgi:transcriptional regulator with XRE-family HTH domain
MAEMDQDQLHGTTVGERLRVTREQKGMSLDDVARQTRIPIRHLEHIERGEWDALPATTYSIGFARSYANAIGMDGPAIGAELRDQLGKGSRPTAAASHYEPTDPARVPPRSLAIAAALTALVLLAAYLFWRSSAVEDGAVDESQIVAGADPAPAPAPAQAPPSPSAPSGPVVLTATDEIWLHLYDGTRANTIRMGTLRAGDRIEIPATAQAPKLRTTRPQALRITVGATEIPALGPPDKLIADASLLPGDLAARAPGGAQPVRPAAAPLED